ncbi:uncharacterized protein LOC141851696 [Brevipalpus obovatus]|uniref:uncharacterized protein LOC141851696 n=1 Tax=Brevipalpus obovatus TaxID=246614 RepID=UPI003D9F85AD
MNSGKFHHSNSSIILITTSMLTIITLLIQMRPAQSSLLIDRISKRAAYFGGEPSRDNSYHKSTNKDSPCDDSGVLVMRPCSYEECLESKYPYVGVCKKWDETEWSEKVKICSVEVNPCVKE